MARSGASDPACELEDEGLALPARGVETAHDIDRCGHVNGTCARLFERLAGRALVRDELRVLRGPGVHADQNGGAPLVGQIVC